MKIYFTLKQHSYFPIELRAWEKEAIGNFISYDGSRHASASCYFTNDMAEEDCTAFILKYGHLVYAKMDYV